MQRTVEFADNTRTVVADFAAGVVKAVEASSVVTVRYSTSDPVATFRVQQQQPIFFRCVGKTARQPSKLWQRRSFFPVKQVRRGVMAPPATPIRVHVPLPITQPDRGRRIVQGLLVDVVPLWAPLIVGRRNCFGGQMSR